MMTELSAPLLFPEILEAPGLWAELGKPLGLSARDLQWLGNVRLARQEQRSRETPPMYAYRILLNANGAPAVPLAGSFVLSATPDDRAVVMYSPLDGVRKFDDLDALSAHLNAALERPQEDDPRLSLLSLAHRKRLASEGGIHVTYALIEGDIFDDQRSVIEQGLRDNAQALLDELLQLPTLTAVMEDIFAQRLRPAFARLDQRLTRVSFADARWPRPMSLGEAALLLYRHPLEPDVQVHFSHPSQPSDEASARAWKQSLHQVAGTLLPLLFECLERYWDGVSADGHSRRAYFALAMAQQAYADIMLKREAQIIDSGQCRDLLRWIRPGTGTGATRSTKLETVRLWDYRASQVELAGSLMINRSDAFLYTPSQGFQVLRDYRDLRETVLAKFSAKGHEDEYYGLLGLEERRRFLTFNAPQVSGEPIAGDIFRVLFEAIVTKQRQNLEFILQVYRHSDGAVDPHALFDKALDIRSMIHERLLGLGTHGRWSTQPVLTGSLRPSQVLADKATAQAKTFVSVQTPLAREFSLQPTASLAEQRAYLNDMKPRIAHALSVGVNGEARLRVLNGTLHDHERAIVETVFNPEHSSRRTRRALNGFRPDAYSLSVLPSGANRLAPLANCFLLTERGGLDARHSGRAVLWTPARGAEVFGTIDKARAVLRRRLEHSEARLTLLENLAPSVERVHRAYTLGPLQLIEGNVLHDRAQSSIDRFFGQRDYWHGFKLEQAAQDSALKKLAALAPDTNLNRATALAHAIALQQTLPAWLGMVPVNEQRLQIELLEQLRHLDADDYLHDLPTLGGHVRDTLKQLLANRFPGKGLDPDRIEITPTLALAGPARSLTEHALRHVSETQGNIRIALASSEPVPPGLDQSAVRQLLLSLQIPATFAGKVSQALSEDVSGLRRQRFARRLPWQLLQHAHALKLQQHLSSSAFDLIHQVLDMPDAIARGLVQGAHALMRPLELIKTAGAEASRALGLYLIGPRPGTEGPQVLYAPYHAGQLLREFADEAAVVAALCAPGPLQDLLIRRLPEAQRPIFASLFKDGAGQTDDMTLASAPIDGNLLDRLFDDNIRLLEHLIAGQSLAGALPDWEAVKQLFSETVSPLAVLLPGKAGAIPFLWQAIKDLRHSVQALEQHHWKQALGDFISDAAQMVALGRLRLKPLFGANRPVTPEPVTTVSDPHWDRIRSTAPIRTCLQEFEAPTVSLHNLRRDRNNGTFVNPSNLATYAAVAGKVYRVARAGAGAGWRLVSDAQEGPFLERTASGQLVLDPDRHTLHFGKGMSTLRTWFVDDKEARLWLNIEARGMEQIRARHPEKARMLVQAVDLARFYAFNSLHNLAQLKTLMAGARLDRFLKPFFGVSRIDEEILAKIAKAIVPLCKALVDPTDDLLNTERFVIGSNKYHQAKLIAFVIDKDDQKRVHFTEHFFDQQLDWYKSGLTEPFNVDGHAQASTLIHEFSHQFCKTVDIASLEARRPFSDLIATITRYGLTLKDNQQRHQREALSLETPRQGLFARWSAEDGEWIDLDQRKATHHVAKAVLDATLSPTLERAREAFLDPDNPHPRIDTILRNADSIAFLICEMGRQLDPLA